MFIPFFLYAEIHHKRAIFPNFLWNDEPEIVADFPHRVDYGIKNIPFVLNIKDADKWPIILKNVDVKILFPGEKYIKNLFSGELLVKERIFQKLFLLEREFFYAGEYPVIVEIRYFLNGKERVIENHNYKTLQHKLWYINFASEKLPKFEDIYYGDIHYHSVYSDDDVEFGQSLDNTTVFAKAMGLSFMAITDHSYDLDDIEGKWHTEDKELKKWHKLQDEVDKINNNEISFSLIRGEELSCGNVKNRNVHMLVLGNRKFYYGCGDSTDHPFKTKPKTAVKDVSKEYLLVAAHPFEGYSFLPYIFLRRGKWEKEDLEYVDGLQFYNGVRNKGFERGKKEWIKLLLEGKKKFVFAGTDAHGDFNRAIKVKIPFLKIVSNDKQIAGRVKTAVLSEKTPNEKILLKRMKAGHHFITDGPALEIEFSRNEEKYIMGDTVIFKKDSKKQVYLEKKDSNCGKIKIKAKSSDEFGKINLIKIFIGYIGAKTENIFKSFTPNELDFSENIPFCFNKNCYMRCEAETDKGKIAITNPIFFEME